MNHDVTEEFFRLRGWEKFLGDWVEPLGSHYETLPKICESMTDWIKYVAEFMEGEGYRFEITVRGFREKGEWSSVEWNQYDDYRFPVGKSVYKEIKDHQILYTSVLAANEYLKGRQNDKS